MNRTRLFFAITLLSGLTGCGVSASSEGTLFVSGRIDGDTVDLSAKRPGRVVELTVREGDSVQAGQVLAVLSSDQDEARFDQQKALVLSGERKLQQLKRQLATYGERVRQAQIFEEQAQADAPGRVKEAEANLATSK